MILTVFKHYLDARESLKQKLTIQDFDCWVGGFVSGAGIFDSSLKKEYFDELIKFLLVSEEAKRCGVFGTKDEIWKEYGLN